VNRKNNRNDQSIFKFYGNIKLIQNIKVVLYIVLLELTFNYTYKDRGQILIDIDILPALQ
jgi:hypothetical protein